MRRLPSTIGSGAAFIFLALTLSGCFQPVGAALPATPVGAEGTAVVVVPTTEPSPTFDFEGTFAAGTAAANAVLSLTPLFPPTETPTPTETVPPTNTFAVTEIAPTPEVFAPTNTPEPPTNTFVPASATFTPFQLPATETPTLSLLDQQATLFAESTAIFDSLTATARALGIFPPSPVPSETPTNTPDPTATPTFPPVATETPSFSPLVIPTLDPVSEATLKALLGGPATAVEEATPTSPFPTSTLFIPTAESVAVALQGTPIAQDDPQATLNAQATQIITIITATAASNMTATAQALGIGQPVLPSGPTATFLPPAILVGSGTPTYPPGTPGFAGSGAAGPIDAGCRYTVVAGDRLLRIALRFGASLSRIAALNGIVNRDMLRPGQVLVIPNCGLPTVPPPAVTSVPPATGEGRIYVVQEGDTLWRIAQRFGVRVMTLAQVNGIENISLIYIGQRLVIP
ncbi:MAG: LysM peptidoglycan-binding domain-containing protein [Anaerolinea sp.]|nr:LysM peptidoglycan-binding domain-containing protein [Anaerolinea sp.]CAG1013902.1 Muramidase-2 [Anaerolineae bacterium]